MYTVVIYYVTKMPKRPTARKWKAHSDICIDVKQIEDVYTVYTDARGYLSSIGTENAWKRCTVIVQDVKVHRFVGCEPSSVEPYLNGMGPRDCEGCEFKNEGCEEFLSKYGFLKVDKMIPVIRKDNVGGLHEYGKRRV